MRVWGHGMASNNLHESCDAVMVDYDLGFYAVADAGGTSQPAGLGAVAALQVMRESLGERRSLLNAALRGSASPAALRDALDDAVLDAHRELLRLKAARPLLRGVEVSAAVFWGVGDRAFIFHVGDARCYRLRAGELQRMSDDQTMVQSLSRTGRLPTDAPQAVSAGDLTSALGRANGLEPTIEVERIEHGDRFLLCTDGLSDQIRDEGALRQALGAGLVGNLPESLIRFSLAAGAPSAAIVVLQVEDVARSEVPAVPLWRAGGPERSRGEQRRGASAERQS